MRGDVPRHATARDARRDLPGMQACDDGCEQASAEREPIPGFSYRTQRDAAQAHDLEAAQPARRDQQVPGDGGQARGSDLARLLRRGRGECVPAAPTSSWSPSAWGIRSRSRLTR